MEETAPYSLCTLFLSLLLLTSLSQSVIGTAGDTFSSSQRVNGWTIGELMTDTYIQSGQVFTQGFHQPQAKTADVAFSISVYPNPIMDSLNIKISQIGTIGVEVYNMLGQKVIDQNTNVTLSEAPITD